MCLYCRLCVDTFFLKDLFGGKGQDEVLVEVEVGHLVLYLTRVLTSNARQMCVYLCEYLYC